MSRIQISTLLACVLPACLFAQTSIRPSSAAGSYSYPSSRASGGGGSSSASGGSSGGGSSTRQYRNNTMLGDALIQIDPESRSLIIVADDETNAEVMKVIKNLDRPKPQVLIKVLFAQVTLDKSLDLGVEGSYNFNVGHLPISQLLSSSNGLVQSTTSNSTTTTPAGGTTTTNTTTTNPLTTSPLTSGSGSLQTVFGLASQTTGAFFRLNTSAATETLYALAQKGNVTVLSRPSILARNNQEAVMVVGQEVPFITNSQITNNGQTINTIQYQDVGIILRVTPFITANRTVEMIVSPEISALSDQTVAVSPTVNAPVINKTSAETVVVTPDATTVVIGGMMQKQKTNSVSKVPLLGDIPLLGFAFRHSIKSDTKTELLIFLTPYIVEGTENLRSLSVQETNRTDLPQTAFEGDDYRRYLDNLNVHNDSSGVREIRRATPARGGEVPPIPGGREPDAPLPR